MQIKIKSYICSVAMKQRLNYRVMKKVTHLVCPMSAEGLTKGKVYPVLREEGFGLSPNLHYILDNNNRNRLVSTEKYVEKIHIHRGGWTPYDPNILEKIYDKYICRNYYTAMIFIVIVLAILIIGLCR